MDKVEIARRQLGMATHLFIENFDSISIHSLAGNAREIIDRQAKAKNIEAFPDHVTSANPNHSHNDYFAAANLYRNAFKHLDRDGDSELVEDFDDINNMHLIFVCWYSYGRLVGKLPIEAQCFELWYFAQEQKRTENQDYISTALNFFGDMQYLTLDERKECLKKSILIARNSAEIVDDERTEDLPLVFFAIDQSI